jgi:metal-responsive CopG/Arc/MetJ family transcriptional regulator
MRTTISIDDDIVEELMRVEPGVSRSEAMRKAVGAYILSKKRQEFLDLAGSGLVDLDWREAKQRELDKLRRHGRKG